MQISFNGIKNTSSVIFKNEQEKYTDYNVSIQLTDDYNGKDLTKYKKVLSKVAPQFKHPTNSNFLHIGFFNDSNDDITIMTVNGESIEPKDENLPLFSFIAKLTKCIANAQDKDFIHNRDYVESDEIIDNSVLDDEWAQAVKEASNKIPLTDIGTIKASCNVINNEISKQMAEYFDVVI